MPKSQALILSIVLVFSGPQLVQAQVFSDPGSSQGVYEVDDIYTEAKDTQPSVLKDLFFGTSDKRPTHSSTLKLFDILGKAQKGLETYKNGKKIYDGIFGKNPDSITSGVFSILGQYGIIDPQRAVLANKRATPVLIGKGAGGPPSAQADSPVALDFNPERPEDWQAQAQNENLVYKNAIQKTGDFIYSPEAREILTTQDQVAADAREAVAAAAQGGIESVLASTQVKDQSINSGTAAGEFGTSAQSSKSTQSVNKLKAKQNAQIASILAGNAFQLNAVNESIVTNTSALGNIVATQSILVDKQTVSQYLDAAKLRQQGQIYTTLNNYHEQQRNKDAIKAEVANDADSILHFPGLATPTQLSSPSPQP